jgi:hypothetical protein
MQPVSCLAKSATNPMQPVSYIAQSTTHTIHPVSYLAQSASHQCKPSPYLPSVKWKVLKLRQIIKQDQANFILFFHDFDDSQRVTFYARIVRLMHVLCIASRQVAGLRDRGEKRKRV